MAVLGVAGVDAATSRFEVQMPFSSTYFQFPGLDLNNVEKIKLTTSTTMAAPGYNIDRMEIVFPNANNLVINNLKADQSGASFHAVVNNGWVFRKLVIDVGMPAATPMSGDNIDVSVFAANAVYFNDNFAMPPQGEMLVSASGPMVNVTRNPVADRHWMKVNNKGLNMRLYQRAESRFMAPTNPANGFKLYMNWMGHGERTVYLTAPFQPQDYDKFKAVALNVITSAGPAGDVYFLEVEFEDEIGSKQTVPVGDLQSILDQAYQP
ncbi:MAG: hypothetical protein KZQ76_08545 [Candidatus Thiodiazotropha sp. (ex Epidulcina cf. delphinae)]|nr:hypothetical protein [Candidatus Thiodiazotropha sp. (ex Epidulcina cf. delphinae)]